MQELTYVFLIIDCPCNAGLADAIHTTCHFINLKDMQIYSGTEVTDIIKDNNETLAFDQLGPSPNKPKFHGIYFKKNKWFAKTFDWFFTKLSQPKF